MTSTEDPMSQHKSLPGFCFMIPGESIPGWDLLNPLASLPLQLVKSEGQNQRSYFLKTSYTAWDKLKSKVHVAVSGGVMGERAKRRNSKQPKKGPPETRLFTRVKGKSREGEKNREVSCSRCHCCWEPAECETGCGDFPTPILLSVCVCVYVHVCKRDREGDIGRVWLFNLALPPFMLVCVCVFTLPTPNLSTFTGSQIKWSELAINAVLSRPVGSRQARCVSPASPAAWED